MLKIKALRDFTYQGLTAQKSDQIEVDDAIGNEVVRLGHAKLVDGPKPAAAVEPFEDRTKDELKAYLDGRSPPVEYPSDALHEDLVKLAKSQSRKEARAAKE